MFKVISMYINLNQKYKIYPESEQNVSIKTL